MDEECFSTNFPLTDMKLSTETLDVAVKYAPSEGRKGLFLSWMEVLWGNQSTFFVADSRKISAALGAQLASDGERTHRDGSLQSQKAY